jgi:hypothetical protein
MGIFSCPPPSSRLSLLPFLLRWSASIFFQLAPIVCGMMSLAIINAIFGTVGTWFGALRPELRWLYRYTLQFTGHAREFPAGVRKLLRLLQDILEELRLIREESEQLNDGFRLMDQAMRARQDIT